MPAGGDGGGGPAPEGDQLGVAPSRSISEALYEQLGPKLAPTKVFTETVVIDHRKAAGRLAAERKPLSAHVFRLEIGCDKGVPVTYCRFSEIVRLKRETLDSLP